MTVKTPITMVAALLAVLAFSAAPALAAAPETPVTREAEPVTGTTATLNGELNPSAAYLEEEEYEFAYAPSSSECTGGLVAPEPAATALGHVKEDVFRDVTGLEGNTEYAFCVVAIHTPLGEAPEPAYGSPLTFKTSPIAPKVDGVGSSGVTSSEATIEAQVNPENQPSTSCEFEYGATTAYGKEAPCAQPVLEGSSDTTANAALTNLPLAAAKTYHFRVVVKNASGEVKGPDGEFETVTAKAPEVVSENASGASSTGATLEAQVNPEYQTTSYQFEYSTKKTGGGMLEAPITIVKGSGTLTGFGEQTAGVPSGLVLAPGTTYYYRVVAVNSTGTEAGTVQSFTTVPTPHTDTATGVTATTAILHGHLTLDSGETKYAFDYRVGSECTGEHATTPIEAGAGTVSAEVTELQPNATYTVCLVTSNAFGEQVDTTVPAVSFKAHAAVPSAEGESASPTPFEATLEAQVNPNNEETTCEFEYGTDSTLTTGVKTKSCAAALGNGGAPVGASAIVTGLTRETTYYFRVVAKNLTGRTIDSTIATFETATPVAPVIESESVSAITPTGVALNAQTSATLEAQVNPNYQETTYTFEYAEHESEVLKGKGKTVSGKPIPPGSIATGFSDHLASAEVSGLEPDKKYFYRVVATNATGSAVQIPAVASFVTSTFPRVSIGHASGVTTMQATVSWTVYPDGLPTSYYVQYGGPGYGKQTPPFETPPFQAGDSIGPVPVEVSLRGLAAGDTYHYRIIATNTNLAKCSEIIEISVRNECNRLYEKYGTYSTPQTAHGEDATFTTPSTPATPPSISGVSVQGVSQSGATVVARLETRELPTHYELLLGATQGQLQQVATGNVSSTAELSLPVGALTPGTTYYYKLVAVNPDGETPPAEGSFTTASGPAAAASGSLPALIPYQSIAELNAKEAKEDKGLPGPAGTKSLTKAEKLKKALKACHSKKGKKRSGCEAAAKKKFGAAKKKGRK
jgi:phosphodiesterase/alkaline phosphatase D-like protein